MDDHFSRLQDRAAFSIERFARDHDIGRTKTLELIKSGQLTARKVGTRTIITAEDARIWRKSLPRVQRRREV
jgi:hypothetical protein